MTSTFSARPVTQLPIKHPCLMASKEGRIILALDKTDSTIRGVLLYTPFPYEVLGELHKDWDALAFSPYYGTVTLQSNAWKSSEINL